MTTTELLLTVVGSGGLLFMVAEKIMAILSDKQAHKNDMEAQEKDIRDAETRAEIKDRERFQEVITDKLIQQLLDQFNSFQRQNERFQTFFFESLDPLLKEVRDNSQEVGSVLTQIDLLTRSMREVTESNKEQRALMEGVLSMVNVEHGAGDSDHSPIVHTVSSTAGRKKVKSTVKRRVIKSYESEPQTDEQAEDEPATDS